MSLFQLKPTHAPVKAYYAALAQFQLHGHTTEGNTRSDFADLLKKCSTPYGWLSSKSTPSKAPVSSLSTRMTKMARTGKRM